jgi:hypothetical protein
MNNNVATSLDRLHDIVTPSAVPWWPPAPGWYWLIALTALLLLTILLKTFIRRQHNRYRHEALRELMQLEGRLKLSGDRAAALLELSELLKRTALTIFAREDVAKLTGTRWFAFLDSTGHKTDFSNGLGAVLENAVYDPRTVSSLDEQTLHKLTSAARHWIKHHDPNIHQPDTKKPKNRLVTSSSLPFVQSS